MPLRTLQPSGSVTARIATEVRGMARRTAEKSLSLGGSPDSVLGMAAPHPVFNLGLDSLETTDWLEHVAMTGWRYFVTSNEGVVATAEASSESAGGPIKGTMTNEGPFVTGTETALALVESDPKVASGTFVLGLLRVPAIYVVALWLRGEAKSAGTDWIVPIAPTPEPLRPNVLTHPNDFVKALLKLKRLREAATPNAVDSPSN